MFLGGLETLCMSAFVLALLLFAGLFALALFSKPRHVPSRELRSSETPPATPTSAFQLSHYFPLPEGYAYAEEADGTPRIVRLEDDRTLSFTVGDDLLTFEDPPPNRRGQSAPRRQVRRRSRHDETSYLYAS